MARRATIEREELFETANQMAVDGKEVTALTLLNTLGGGSLTTIYKYLAEWEAQRPKDPTPTGRNEIPDNVQNAFANVWRVATQEAARETAVIKEKAAEEVRAAQKQFESALEAIRKLEQESEQDAALIDELKEKLATNESALNASNNENAGLKATSEQLQNQVNAQQQEIDRLHQRSKELDEKLSSAYSDREAAIKEASEMKGQIDALKGQNSELISKLAKPGTH